MVSAVVQGLGLRPGSGTAAASGKVLPKASGKVLPKASEKVLPKVQGSANSPTAKARGSVTGVVPEQDEELAQALAGGRGSSTGTSTEDGTQADGAQPAA